MKDTIIIVEGPQGVGKTTFTNYLREKIASTDLYRLTGIKDKTEAGYLKIKRKYMKLLEMWKTVKMLIWFLTEYFSQKKFIVDLDIKVILSMIFMKNC